MTERSYQDAVQVLKDQMGGSWEGLAVDGRDEMERILKDRLGYTDAQADDAIDAMIESGTLRYHDAVDTPAVADDTLGVVPVVPPVAVGPGGSTSGQGAPVPVAIRPGYWQIGEEGIGVSETRKGQVEPR